MVSLAQLLTKQLRRYYAFPQKVLEMEMYLSAVLRSSPSTSGRLLSVAVEADKVNELFVVNDHLQLSSVKIVFLLPPMCP